uniref:Transient receptor potential cation channel, subfamily M, member 2 n=1 Tax=Cyprinus carpio TaxID=7962 RepID=A0A8C2K394_CYPCA
MLSVYATKDHVYTLLLDSVCSSATFGQYVQCACCWAVTHVWITWITVDREGICKCGYPKDKHCEDPIKPEDYVGEQWDRHRHTKEAPTDAFGDISFGGLGQKTGKYVRVSSDTPCEILYQLMTDCWKLRSPNLLISVTGGAKNFNIKPLLKEKFRRGLIKVAQTTGAWILTGGTHTGVMKHVGMAVRDYTLSSGLTEGQIVVIGVAPWGVIHRQEDLINPKGNLPVQYSLDEQGQGLLSCLDINHTHFLLVDDGTRDYGVEIELRARLEKHISQQSLGNRGSGVTIPVVCVVLDGGPGTLNTMYNVMLNHTPCVVLEGSGRMADVIAKVADLPVSEVTLDLIKQLMERFFGQEYKEFTEVKVIEWTKKIQDIIRMSHLLTVFHIDEDKNSDVDVAILQALLKVPKSDEHAARQSLERQLELAVAWNRVDIAESEIFTEEIQWTSCDLHPAMFSALVGDKPEFVRLLLENGVCVGKFLESEDMLCELYAHLPSCFFLRKLAKRVQGGKICRGQEPQPGSTKISLSHVAEEVRHLLGSFTQPLYVPRVCVFSSLFVVVSQVLSKGLVNPSCLDEERTTDKVWDSIRDLFLWAVVQNNPELAEISWEQCRDCIAAALAACKILRKLAQESGEDDSEEAKEMRELASHYEKQAIGVFSECHSWDAQRAQKLLIRVSPSWGRSTCLWLALKAEAKSFIAHSGVQALLTQIWFGELSVDNAPWKVLLCMIFFPLIYTSFLTFSGSSQEPELKPLNCSSRLMSLFTSPQVKFYWNIASYFGFLWLFAVVLMIDFQNYPSWRELLLYVWLTSLVCEELRQFYHDFDGPGFRKKAKMYISDMWNILDVLSIILFIAGLVCRLQASGTVFYVGKVILCIDFIIFCLRLMAIFTISRTLGPKIIILRRMMMDLFFFMFLLSIWVVAYGVAKQGILIHNEERLNWIIRGAVYEPYLIIFGSVPTNIDSEQFTNFTTEITRLRTKGRYYNSRVLICKTHSFSPQRKLFLAIMYKHFKIYTFEEVQDNTDTIWKFQRYELIKEYHSRPALPPPFILLSHLILFIRGVLLRYPPQKHKPFRQELEKTEEEELLSWEAYMKDNYLSSTRQVKSQSMEHRVQDTAEK